MKTSDAPLLGLSGRDFYFYLYFFIFYVCEPILKYGYICFFISGLNYTRKHIYRVSGLVPKKIAQITFEKNKLRFELEKVC
jgi:hypothetical protein